MSSLDITHHEREADGAQRAWDEHHPPELDLIRDCVHCGFCLPTCPSYAVFEEEMDSPRGRILLMRVGHEEGSEISPEMVTHFDRCLGCMACVTACPSGVQYDRLIERTRPQLERHERRERPQAAGVGEELEDRAALGLTWIRLEGDDLAARAEAVRAALAPRACTLQDAPAAVRTALTPWAEPDPGALTVMRRVKERFDPARIFNPGSFVGGI